jgi:uncharacterized protein YegL
MNNTTKKTIVGTILIDRSGSMSSILSTLITSLHSFIDETKQTAEDAEQCYFRIATFSTTRNVVYPPTPMNNPYFGELKAVDNDTIRFNTYGCTRLIDSAIEEIDILSNKLNELENKNILSWFVLLTDGEDNMSVSNNDLLKTKVNEIKEKGVHCIFMGANIDAIKTGEQYGFSSEQTLQVDMDVHEDQTNAPLYTSFRAISQNMTQTLNNDDLDMSFSTIQRTSSAPSHFTNRTLTIRQSPIENNTIIQPPQITRQHAVTLDEEEDFSLYSQPY